MPVTSLEIPVSTDWDAFSPQHNDKGGPAGKHQCYGREDEPPEKGPGCRNAEVADKNRELRQRGGADEERLSGNGDLEQSIRPLSLM